MKEAVTKVIDTLTQEDFHRAFQNLLEWYSKCIAAGGDYFEGGLEFDVCTNNKSAHTKKSGNLFNDPRIYLSVSVTIYLSIYLYKQIYIYIFFFFFNGPGDLGSILGRVKSKIKKMVLDASLPNTQHYKARFKGKVEQSRERSSALPYALV